MPTPTTAPHGPDRLRALRYLLGMTRPEIAAALEVGPDTVRDWEAGRYRPAAPRLEALGRLLGRAERDLAEVLAHAAAHGALRIPEHRARPGASWWEAIAARALAQAPGLPLDTLEEPAHRATLDADAREAAQAADAPTVAAQARDAAAAALEERPRRALRRLGA